ncbi:MAG: RNA-binding protein [Anaerolineae bacterium]|jgi:RNA recognition motif-containing protein|nr:RNA-binding protein [Anaerolineae bacterium]
MRIYVGNLSYQATEDELRQLFEPYGEVAEINVITDRDTGRSRGFAFVEMPDAKAGAAAIEALDQKDHQGRNLRVNEAQPRQQSGRGGGFGGGGGGGGFGGGGGGGGRGQRRTGGGGGGSSRRDW